MSTIAKGKSPVSVVMVFRSLYLWAGLLLIAGGGMATLGTFPGDSSDYLLQIIIATLIWVFASMLMATCKNIQPAYLIGLVLLVAYFGKFYLAFGAPEISLSIWMQKHMDVYILSPAGWLETYASLNLALGAFALAVFFIRIFSIIRPRPGGFRYQSEEGRESVQSVTFHNSMIKFVIWVVPIMLVVTSVIMIAFGVANMGDTSEEALLPFRLSGLLFFSRMVFIPYALLCCVYSAQELASHRYFMFGIVLFILFALSDMLVRSSKGTLVMAAIMLFLLFVVTNRLKKKYYWFFGLVLAVAVALYPVMASYRIVRMINPNDSFIDILLSAIGMIEDYSEMTSDVSSLSGAALSGFIGRLQGADILALLYATGIQPRYGEWLSSDAMQYLDRIFDKTGTAASMLGWFYLIFGKPAIFFGMFFWTLACMGGWKIIDRVVIFTNPIAKSYFLFWIVTMTTEGTLDMQMRFLLTMLSTVAFFEFMGRRFVKTHTQMKTYQCATQV